MSGYSYWSAQLSSADSLDASHFAGLAAHIMSRTRLYTATISFLAGGNEQAERFHDPSDLVGKLSRSCRARRSYGVTVNARVSTTLLQARSGLFTRRNGGDQMILTRVVKKCASGNAPAHRPKL